MERCTTNDELTAILADDPDVPREVHSHVGECESCGHALEALRNMLTVAGDYCAFLESTDDDLTLETIEQIQRDTQADFLAASERVHRRVDVHPIEKQGKKIRYWNPIRWTREQFVASGLGAGLALVLVFAVSVVNENLITRGGRGTAITGIDGALVLWGGIEPAVNGIAVTNRDPENSRLAIVTSNRKGRYFIFRVSGTEEISPLAGDQWNTCSATEPAVLRISAPGADDLNEWFVACVVPDDIPPGRLDSLADSLKAVVDDNRADVQTALTDALMKDLAERMSSQVSAAAETDCQVFVARWRVNP